MSSTRTLFGFHAVLARLRLDPDSVRAIYLDAARQDARARDLARHAEQSGVRLIPVDGERLDAMAPGARHQGVVAQVSAKVRYLTLEDVLDTLEEPPFLLVLDGITDPHNLGACLRVADCAGVHAVIAPKDRACFVNQTVAKVACGAAETMPYIAVTNLARTLRELKERGICVVGADGEAPSSLYETQWPAASAWVLGSEGIGMRRLTQENCDFLVRIPMSGAVESLNASVAAGVCLFEARRRLGPPSA